jgi:phenylacetate-CoA ligase
VNGAGGFRRPHEAVDITALTAQLPPPPEYFSTAWLEPPEKIAATQLDRLRRRATAAYEVPFFRRRWDEAGIGPDDLRTLDDLHRFPAYTVDDIRHSIEAHPPYGDYQGVSVGQAPAEPMRLFMSGGTTGASRPTLYTAWDREAGALLTARALYLQGIRPGDVVLNAWAYSTHNGAHIMDEALYKWLNCVVLTTGTGNVTPSRRQVELAVQYGATAILTTGDYLLHLADTAREMGIEPGVDLRLTALPNIGDKQRLTETFGVPVLDSYGFHEVQWVAIECEAGDGLHIFEDAFVVQIVDVDTGEPLPDGEQGAICITETYKTGSPQFRYDIRDLSTLHPPGQCACGSWLRKMAPFAGRGDNMVKLRGVNVWPEALGDIATSVEGVGDDWFVIASRTGNRDEMTIRVVSDRDPTEFTELAERVASRLHEAVGVRIGAEVVAPGGLDALTGFGTAAKLVRFRDDR